MNKIALITSDAWQHLHEDDVRDFPLFYEEYNSFINYLSVICYYESLKPDIDIIHCVGPKPKGKMNDMTLHEAFKQCDYNYEVLTNIVNISTSYDYYLFCGFHIEQCIKKKIFNLVDFTSIETHKIGIVLNLSNFSPECTANSISFLPDLSHYYWTRNGYRMVDIRSV